MSLSPYDRLFAERTLTMFAMGPPVEDRPQEAAIAPPEDDEIIGEDDEDPDA
jgi:hypothetical protein